MEYPRFFRLCWDNLLTLIGLNLLFLVCSVPLVTLPASLTALAGAGQALLEGEGGALRCFLLVFRRELFRALPAGLFMLLLEAAAVWGCLFYRSAFTGLLPTALSVFCLVCAYIVFCAGAYCFNMLARVELGFAGLVRNSFALVFMCPRPLFTWLLLSFMLPLAGAFLLPHSVPLLVLLLISASSLAAARGTLPAVCEYVERK